LDGQHGSFYQSASNINAGTLGAGYFSAYSDLTAELYLNNDADTDLLTRIQSDGRFVNEGQADSITSTMVAFNYAGSASEGGPAADSDQLDGQHGTFYQDASNINAGTLGAGYFSAYSDLTAELYLNNDADTDLLTRLQSDGRYVNTTGPDAITGNFTVNSGNLTVGGEMYYSSSQTRYYHVGRDSMVKSPAETQAFVFGLSTSSCPDGVTCGIISAVQLPERATVTALRVWGSTTSSAHNFVCALQRPDHSGGMSTMASVTSTNTTMILATTTIANPAIDNANYQYQLDCHEDNSARGATVNIYAMRIDYNVDGPE